MKPSGSVPRGWTLAAYGFAVVAFTWPLAWHPAGVLASVEGPGDAYLNLWILGWDLQTITTHPLALLTGKIFDANIFYPATGTLAYSDHLLLQAVALTPLYLLTGNLVLCYNVLFAGSLFACSLAMHAYVREVTGSDGAAFVSGIAWAFAPFHFGHITHLQLQALYFLPLAFLLLRRLIRDWRRSQAALLGIVLAGQAISSVYYGLIGLLGVVCAAVVSWPLATRRPIGLAVRRALLTAGIAGLLVAPVGYQYWRVQQREGFGRSPYEAARGSASVGAYVNVPPMNLLYGRTGALTSVRTDSGRNPAEQRLFPGFVLTVLALAGTWLGLRSRPIRPVALSLALVTCVGLVSSLGPGGSRILYAIVDHLFAFHAIRAPARFAVLVLFGLAGLAGLGVHALAQRFPRGRIGILVGALLLASAEYMNAPIPYVPAPPLHSALGDWLRDTPGPGAVLYWPLVLDPAQNTSVMLDSLAHGRPIVNGYSGQRPAFFLPLTETVDHFPSAESIATLHALGVRFVVAREPLDLKDWPLVARKQTTEGVVYEIDWSPALEARVLSSDTATIPPPGPVPFVAGETATYTVVWRTGPMTVPAGRAVLQVGPGEQGSRFLLSASVRTAPWMARFFLADDRFTSLVDDQLLPVAAEQHFHEGHRTLDRRMAFDRAARVVRLQQADRAPIALPLPAHALDPVSVFYYLRTLPLAPGTTVRVPFDDAGRNLTVDLRSVNVETIDFRGQRVEALRLEPAIHDQGLQPIGYTIVLWRSRDARQIPLRIDVEGLPGAGAVRLELESLTQSPKS